MASDPPGQQPPKERVPLPVKLDRWLARIAEDPERTRKYLFGVIAGLLGVTFILGVFQTVDTIRSPFVFDGNQATGIDARKTEQIQTLDELRTQDTDEDGLDDYAELYVFNTSPYTPDSDSDGYDDAEEIESGNDPNCPVDQACEFTISSGTSLSATPIASDTDLSAAQIRELLVSSGVPEITVQELTDEQVVQIYQEAQAENPTDVSLEDLSPEAAQAEAATDLEQLLALTPDDIRELLVSSGGDEAQIAELTDDQIQEIFREALVQQYGEEVINSISE